MIKTFEELKQYLRDRGACEVGIAWVSDWESYGLDLEETWYLLADLSQMRALLNLLCNGNPSRMDRYMQIMQRMMVAMPRWRNCTCPTCGQVHSTSPPSWEADRCHWIRERLSFRWVFSPGAP
jgi:hypothetical protein